MSADLIMSEKLEQLEEEIAKATVLTPPNSGFFRNFLNLSYTGMLNDDFPHEKLLTVKYKGRASNFIVNSKGSLNFKTIKQGGQDVEVPVTSYETKFLNSVRGVTLEAKFNNKGNMRLWSDYGVISVGQVPLRVQSVIKTDSLFTSVKAYTIAQYNTLEWSLATRLQARKAFSSHYSIAQKFDYLKNGIRAGLYADLDLNTFYLSQYNALVGYNVGNGATLYAEHETLPTKSGQAPTVALGKLHLTTTYKTALYSGLARLSYNCQAQKWGGSLAGVYYLNNRTTLRAKVDENVNAVFGVRYFVNKNISLVAGTSAPLRQPERIITDSKAASLPFGVQIEFTI